MQEKNRPRPEQDKLPEGFLRHPVHLLATGFGLGCSPRAPGTLGTLWGIPCWLLLRHLPEWAYLGVLLLLFAAGIWICDYTERHLGIHDHGAIVFDEIVGFLVTMSIAPAHDLRWILPGFLLFRLFDIWKPWPIRWIDRNLRGGLGIMLDDLLAGGYAALLLYAGHLALTTL